MIKKISIPEPHSGAFVNGIRHPSLFLWDAWSYSSDNRVFLYCLAINRLKDNGEALDPTQRNGYQFHVRRFSSLDDGITWYDQGVFQYPGLATDGHDSRNVWSGSILKLANGTKLAAYTGLPEVEEARPYVQNLATGMSESGCFLRGDNMSLLLCPVRDEKQIRDAGYYLGAKHQLGSAKGEEGANILAWRDPFIMTHPQGDDDSLIMLWAAKKSADQPAMGIAAISSASEGLIVTELHSPITMPDTHLFSQLEVPKIYFDDVRGRYILVIATTTRLSENQPAAEVEKCIRLYFADDILGPWATAGKLSSELAGVENLFGMTVLTADFEQQKLHCMAPYTEAANHEDMLSFAPVFEVDISEIGQVDQLKACRY